MPPTRGSPAPQVLGGPGGGDLPAPSTQVGRHRNGSDAPVSRGNDSEEGLLG